MPEQEFYLGDEVIRRPGTLGADGTRGKVLGFSFRAPHTLVTVKFPDHEETFITDMYVKAE